MTVAVLGANGQLGSDLVRAGRTCFDQIEVVPLYRRDLDVTDLDLIPKVLSKLEFTVIVNCTSYHRTDEAENRADEAFRINARSVEALAVACKKRGARFVHLSTDYVFGGGSSRPYVETDCPSPLNVYGASKLVGENLALKTYTEGTLIVRVASLFGVAGASGKGGNFVETILRVAREKGEVRVINDVTMSPTATADAARIVLSLIARRAAPGIYHAVNSGQATWFEFAVRIVNQAGIPAKVIATTSQEFPSVAVRPAYSVLDNRKVAAVVGKIPPWEDALQRYLIEKGRLQ